MIKAYILQSISIQYWWICEILADEWRNDEAILLSFTEQAQHLQTLPQQVAGCTLKAGLWLVSNTGTVLRDGKKSASFDRDLLLEIQKCVKIIGNIIVIGHENQVFIVISIG